MSKTQYMTCSVCGAHAGYFTQHTNRDDGYGICRSCVDWLLGRGTTAQEIKNLYGVAGVNYEAKLFRLHGLDFKVLAQFVDDEAGCKLANAYMEDNPGASLLDQSNGILTLAHKDDKGHEPVL